MNQQLLFVLTGCVLVTIFLPNEVHGACEDIDTGACNAMMTKDLNLCSDSVLAHSACPRSCGLCPQTCYSCHATISNMSLCPITTCGKGEMCLLKTKPLPDGSDGYTMACGPQTICSKKRDTEDMDREDRDIFIRCCDQDLCNIPLITTTMPTTTKQRGCIKDFIIMVEDSSSLSPYFQIIKLAVKNILGHMDLETDGTRVAMGTFHGSKCSTRWELDRYTNTTELFGAIDGLQAHPEGSADGFNTVAVEYLLDNFKQGNRPDVPDVILFNSQASMKMAESNFMLSNGHSQADAINQLHQRSDNVIVIAFGNADIHEMEQIASDNNHYMYISSILDINAAGFQQRLGALVQLLCHS